MRLLLHVIKTKFQFNNSSVARNMRGKAKLKAPPCPGDSQGCSSVRFSSAAKDSTSTSMWATNEDWDIHKATIRRLYLTENKPLWDVQDVMRKKYSFNAT